MKLRRILTATLAVGVLSALSGCGDEPNVSDDNGPSVQSAPAVLSKDKFAAEIAAAQTEADSAHFEVAIDVQGQSFEGSGDLAGLGNPDDLRAQFSADFAGEPVEMRLIGKMVYLKGASFAQDGKEWIGINGSDPSNPLSQLFDSANPANFNAYLDGVTDLKDEGTENIAGVETRHYSLTIDTATMLEANPMFEGQDASSMGMPETITSDVYVDADNRPIKLEVTLGDTGTVEATFSDYGKDVTIEEPDPSTVGEFPL